MTTKKCFKCKKIKNIDQFYRHSEMADGHLGKCINCTKKDVSRRYNDPKARLRIVEYEKKRFQDPKRKENVKRYARKRRAMHPIKEKARSRLADAVKTGRLVRLPCEVCGNHKSQAHHTDYRKYLDVKWLCFKHHREAHGQKVSE